MRLEANVSLQRFNTLNLKVRARHFVVINNLEDLREAHAFCEQNLCPWLLLGGGSNLVLTKDFDGLVMLMAMSNIAWPKEPLGESDAKFEVVAEAGFDWDLLVQRSIEAGASGLENLSLIPGQVGAAPIQNIGAYGVEIKDCLKSVEVFDFKSAQVFTLLADECEFGYRDSIFKRKKNWIVTQVTLGLDRQHEPKIGYGVIKDTLAMLNDVALKKPSAQQIREAVIHIRREKLPDPKTIPNVGSFFKNPLVTDKKYQELAKNWPKLIAYPVQGDGETQSYKLAAGWLIDQLGWKGFNKQGVGVHANQALVLVNTGVSSKGVDVMDLAQRIKENVAANFGVELEVEPRLFGSRGEIYL
jgi:UDP-N-acetylmuramate dehydrogenase